MYAVSVLILTLNEEVNLADCIASCEWSDDIVVFDSMSSDSTTQIAATHGARVVERRFDNYAAQRNAALQSVLFKYPWVLMLDADERVPADLAAEITTRVVAADPSTTIFRMRRRDFFLGKWLRRSSGYPTWFGRVLRVGHVRVEREINEEFLTDGAIEHLQAHLHHYPFNKGTTHWFERHNRYSSLEALEKLKARSQPVALRGLVGTDPVSRRRALKQIGYRLPLRPLALFIYFYIVRLGFMDGRAGWYFSLMRSAYEMSIDVKLIEAQRRQRQLPI